MDITSFNNIKEKATNFKYNSLEYVEYEDIKDYELLYDNEQLLSLYGLKDKFNIYEIHWATNEANCLIECIKQLNKKVFISFVPKQWVELFKINNFKEFAVLRDYWMNNLDKVPNCENYVKLTENECEEASSVTLSCKEQSREFFGETADWFKEWISDDNSEDYDYKDRAVLVHKEDKDLAGIVCVATYGHDSKNGTVIWIRELAVNPKFQGKGIGKNLLLQGLNYGKEHGAVRAFLMADDLNDNAIHLYKGVGFIPSEEVGQIDMVYSI